MKYVYLIVLSLVLIGCAVKSGTFECSCDCNDSHFKCSEVENFKLEGI